MSNSATKALSRSYDFLALLSVCSFAADMLEHGTDTQRAAMPDSLGRTIKLAEQLAGEQHDLLESLLEGRV